MPPETAAFRDMQLLALLGALALLVCNAAAGLASRLARGLALAAATVLSAVAQVAGLDSLDMFHSFTFHLCSLCDQFSTIFFMCQSHFSYFSTPNRCKLLPKYIFLAENGLYRDGNNPFDMFALMSKISMDSIYHIKNTAHP